MANYLCEAHGLLADDFPWSFRIYFVSSSPEGTVETTWHGSVKSFWNTAGVNALMPAGTHFTGTSTATLNSAWKQTTKTPTNEDLAGTGGASLPFNSALVITLRSNQANKEGHGRIYWPAPTAASLDTTGYFYKASTITDFVAGANTMIGAWAGVMTPIIFHRKTLTSDNIIKGDIPDNVVVQRRRADKRVPARTSLTF